MEFITSFLATTPIALFLVPVVIILVVLLVVLNKSHQVEAVTPVPVPPVTTTPAPPAPQEVVSQVINNQPPVQPTENHVMDFQHVVTPVQVEAPTEAQHVFTAGTDGTTVVVPSWRPNPEIAIVEEIKEEAEPALVAESVFQVPATPVESLPVQGVTTEVPTVGIVENLPASNQGEVTPVVLPRAPII